MKEILLIRPNNPVSAREIPLGLLSIGTVLDQAGYTVTIIDAGRQRNYKKLISNKINNTLVIGITCQTSEVVNAIEISDYIKHISDVPIIWGGWHPTLFPDQVCSDRSIDFACVGDGEDTMLELVRALESGTSVKKIAGLAFKNNGTVIANPCQGYVDLDALPPMNYHLVDISKYIKSTNFRTTGRRTITYQSSRGCPHRCKFCVNTVTGNHAYRARSPEKIVDEIQALTTEFDIDYVAFIDDNFFVDIKRSKEICSEIINKRINIKWSAECRVDYLKQGHIDTIVLDLMQRSGASKLIFGAESGSQLILKMIEKDITVQQILTSAQALSAFNFTAEYLFMIGIPGETREELMSTLNLVQEIYSLNRNSIIGFSIFTIYPEGALTELVKQRNLFKMPATLQGWLDDEIKELYSNRSKAKPWHDNPKLIDNIVHYARVAYHSCPESVTKHRKTSFLKSPLWFFRILFIRAAQFRIRHLYFHIPLDKMIYKAYSNAQKTWLDIDR
jgi:anaerobic magnesium-protoporphyrin IX monomethyl ester cyclase